MKQLDFFSAWNPPPDVRDVNSEPDLTQQQYADECDLNLIMDKYAAGLGTIPTRADIPLYGDFSNVPDFATARQIMTDAQSKFDSLPARVRDRFRNDPALLLQFLADSKNRSEAIELGLLPEAAPPPKAHKQSGDSVDAEGN